MEATIIKETRTYTIHISVSGVPDVNARRPWQSKDRWFRPRYMVIEMVDQELHLVNVGGGTVLKSGEPSDLQDLTRAWGPGMGRPLDDIGAAPEWVRQIWGDVQAGVRVWVAP